MKHGGKTLIDLDVKCELKRKNVSSHKSAEQQFSSFKLSPDMLNVLMSGTLFQFSLLLNC